jgi:signal peptidase I
MVPTLEMGDMFIADTRPRALRDLKRNDLVIHRSGEATDTVYVRRIIGLPGETIVVANDNVTANGERLDQPFAHGANVEHGVLPMPVKLGADEYFLMGDNRSKSLDSRYQGPFRRSLIFGKVSVIYYSVNLDRIGPVR